MSIAPRLYYTIPSDNRELQHHYLDQKAKENYTIPSDNRELQRRSGRKPNNTDYTIPSDNRELQPLYRNRESVSIIPYQVITGNYNCRGISMS